MNDTKATLKWFLSLGVLCGFSLATQVVAATNEWTKNGSGSWEEPYWSLGRLPGVDQDLVAFRNPGWKALQISANTSANFPGSLLLNEFIIDAPPDGFNQLLLNWAGLQVPLVVRSNLFIGPNGSLASHYSALQATVVSAHGPVSFSDYSTEEFLTFEVWGSATILESGTMTCSNLTFVSGKFVQSGGTHNLQSLYVPEGDGYYLENGILTSSQIQIGNPWGYVPGEQPVVLQTGGIHTNGEINMIRSDGAGAYRIDGGLLISSNVNLVSGNAYIQNGGTGLVQNLVMNDGGRVTLTGGELVAATTSMSLGYSGSPTLFTQSGGIFRVIDTLSVGVAGTSSGPTYQLAGGNLIAPEILIQHGRLSVESNGVLSSINLNVIGGVLNISGDGVVSNTGVMLISTEYGGGLISADNATQPQNLGKLKIVSGGSLDMHASPFQPLSGTILRFTDSREVPWTGQLLITNWGLHSGDHVFVGSDSQSLTPEQLSQVFFARADGKYPALLLNTGELVPMPRNEWTKSGTGTWEEPWWTLGRLPGMDQALIVFNTPGSNTLVIGSNTAANHSESLSLNQLFVEPPSGSFNHLFLDWAGLETPLSVRMDLTIGPNAALTSRHSALRATNAFIYGSASFTDDSKADLGYLLLRSDATVTLEGGAMMCSNLTFFKGTFNQLGGTNHCGSIVLPGTPNAYYESANGRYLLSGGLLVSGHIPMGWKIPYGPDGPGYFEQQGGVHSNRSMTLGGVVRGPYPGHADRYGSYGLKGGLLVSDSISVDSGVFGQTGGTNYIANLRISNGGSFSITGGELVTSNLTFLGSVEGYFFQTNGSTTVQNKLLLDGTYSGYSTVHFSLLGGRLITSEIEVGAGVRFLISDASILNSKLFTLRDYGEVGVARVTDAQLGKLRLLSSAKIVMDTGSALEAATLRFQDSREIPWAGTLKIQNWRSGYHHVFIGTSAQGLTPDQLSRVVFALPDGTAADFPAAILPTGEVVPAVFQNFIYAMTNGTVTITDYKGPGGAVIIPAVINGLPVVSIGDYVFSSSNTLTSVMIPDSVTSIGLGAFGFCTSLTNVVLGNGLTNIGAYAFIGANFPDLILPKNLLSIGNGAFQSCRQLSTIIVPDSVVTLGEVVFAGCENVRTVVIGRGVKKIPLGCFSQCSSLVEITMPLGVADIGDNAFSYSTNLVLVNFQGNAPGYGAGVFNNAFPTIRYLPGTTGWGTSFAERPTAPWVLPEPVILTFGSDFGFVSNRFGFVISWASNATVAVEACTDLKSATWVSVSTNILTSGSLQFVDPQPTNHPARLYRVRY